MKKLFFRLFLVLVVAAGVIFFFYSFKKSEMAEKMKGFESFAMPPDAVATWVMKSETWSPVLRSVGGVKPVNGVIVTGQEPGLVESIEFVSGSKVKKGDLLVKLDTSVEEAQLRSSEARVSLADVSLKRAKDLRSRNANAQSDLDTAVAEYSTAVSLSDQIRVKIDQKLIKAPFDGILGIRQINVGQYFDKGNPIVPLYSLDPIYVNFSLPQQYLSVMKEGKQVRIGSNAIGDEKIMGEITAVNPQVDEATRNFEAQATLVNTNGLLRPGMFVDVEVLMPERTGVLAIPVTAINYAPYGDSVFVVKPMKDPKDGKDYTGVEQRFVKMGVKQGDFVEIVSGLSEGEEVATSGVFKLHGGSAVNPSKMVEPGSEMKPKPADT